jgi:hypothetical protein
MNADLTKQYIQIRAKPAVFVFLEGADLSALWYLATCRLSSSLNVIPPPAATGLSLLKAVTSPRTPYSRVLQT